MPPIYEFQCNNCKCIEEHLMKASEASDARFACLSCRAPMFKIVSAPPGVVKGSHNPCSTKTGR